MVFGTQLRPVVVFVSVGCVGVRCVTTKISMVYFFFSGLFCGAHSGTHKLRVSDSGNTFFMYCHCVTKATIILEFISQALEGCPHCCSTAQGIWLPGPTWSCTSLHQSCPTFRSNWRLVCCSEDDWRTMGCILGYRPKFKVATYSS